MSRQKQKKRYKIAIVGTHYVGKTTLCKKLVDHMTKMGLNAGFIGEVVRDCPFPVNEMGTLGAQDWILEEQKKREEAIKHYDVLVLDRGMVDNFAYWLRIAQKKNLDEKVIENRRKDVFEHSKSYDAIFFLQPFDGSIEDDNFRSIDPVWRKEMHERIEKIMKEFEKEYEVPVFYIKGGKSEVFEQTKRITEDLIDACG